MKPSLVLSALLYQYLCPLWLPLPRPEKFKYVIKTWSNCWACTCFLTTEETAAGAALLPDSGLSLHTSLLYGIIESVRFHVSSYSSAYPLLPRLWSPNFLLSVSLHFHLPRARRQILGFCTAFCFMKRRKLLGKIWERSVHGFVSAPDVASYHCWLCGMSYVLWSWFDDNPVFCWGTVSSGATIQYT